MEPNNGHTVSPAPNRILDRKIESKALSSGFSSNLGRKAPVADKGSGGRSVKSIVNWLEKTAAASTDTDTAGTRTSQAQNTRPERDNVLLSEAGKTGAAKVVTPASPPSGSMYLPTTPLTHPEEYSLTLLKYKSYFNNRPLARCLDYEDGCVESPPSKTTPKAASSASASSVQKLDNLMATLDEMSKDIEPSTPTPQSRAQIERGTKSKDAGHSTEPREKVILVANREVEVQSGDEPTIRRRDRAEAKAF